MCGTSTNLQYRDICPPRRLSPYPPNCRDARPRYASTLKNAGLAYLNLVKSPRQDSGGEQDVLLIPYDPLGAAPLLPWKIEGDSTRRKSQRELDNQCADNGHDATKISAVRGLTIKTEGGVRPSRAVGDWRASASARFMQLWKYFLEHEDAPLDSQYHTIRNIYEQLRSKIETPSRDRSATTGKNKY